VKRFIAASSQRAIRDRGETCDGACRDGRRPNQILLAAGAKEYERRELSRRAERRGMAGTSATSSAAVRRELDEGVKRGPAALGHHVLTEPGLKNKTRPTIQGGSENPPRHS